jgi:hypothetical protein
VQWTVSMCPKKLTNFDFDLSDALGKRKQDGFWKHSAPTSLHQLLLMFHDLVYTYCLFSFSLWFIFVFLYSPETANIYLVKIVRGFLKSQLQKQLFCTTHTVHFHNTHPSPWLTYLQVVGCWDWEFLTSSLC